MSFSFRSVCYLTTALVLPSVLVLPLIARPASSAELVVTNFTDSSVSGQLSLREAIAQAQTGDTIRLTAGSPTTITLNSMLTIDKSVTIDGSGTVTVSGGNAVRVFTVDAQDAVVTLKNFTIADGLAQGLDGAAATGNAGGGGGGAGLGGGLFVDAGSVTLDTMTFADNKAVGGAGGATSTGTNGTGGTGGRGYASTPPLDPQAPQPGGGGGEHVDGGAGGYGAGGGGGGGSTVTQNDADKGGRGGRGGFGAGGGGGGTGTRWTTTHSDDDRTYTVQHDTIGTGGSSIFGGGAGGADGGRGGGGAGLGGAVFVRQGATVTLKGGISYAGDGVTGGAGASSGQAIGQALFLAGSATIDVEASTTSTITETLGGGNNSLIDGGVTKTGEGVLVLGGDNSYAGATGIQAGTLRTSGGNAITDTSAVTVDAGAVLDLSANETIGSLAGSGEVTLNAHTLTTGANNTNAAFGGVVSGSGGLTKTGSGEQTLSGTNLHTGGTHINGGAIKVGADVNLGALGGALSFDGGTLRYGSGFDSGRAVTLNTSGGTVDTSGNDATLSGVISGIGSLTKSGTGTLTLSGTNSYSGGTVFQNGVVHVTGDGNLGAAGGQLTFTGGTLRLGAADISSGRAVSLSNGTIDTNGFDAALTGTISDYALANGVLVKTGNGSLSLSGNNTYKGGTIVNGGAVNVHTDGNLGAYGTMSAIPYGGLTLDGGTLRYENGFTTGRRVVLGSGHGTIDTNGHDVTQAGVISGSGGLTKAGTGTLTLSGVNTHTGGTTVAGGTLRLGASDVLSDTGAISVASGAVFDVAGRTETVGALSGAGGVTLGAGSLTTNGATDTTFSGTVSGTGSLTKAGAGTLTLSGVNTHTGSTTVAGGMLRLGTAGALAGGADLVLNAGTMFDVNGFSATIGSLTGTGTVTLGAGNLTLGTASDFAFGGAITGTGGLTKAGTGTLTLSGANTHIGATTINGGTLRLGAPGTLAGNGSISVASGAVFDVNGQAQTIGGLSGAGDITLGAGSLTLDSASATQFSGVVSGSGSLTKAGTGTLTLSGSNTHAGGTTIAAGILEAGADANLGTGALTLDGGLLRYAAGFASARSVVLGGGGLDTNGFDATLSGVLSGAGGLTKTGAGTLTLTGTSTYVGGTTVAGGALAVGADASLGTGDLTLDGGTLRYTGAFDTGRSIALNGGSLDTNGFDTTLSGTISGSNGLTKSGSGALTLSGTNTYAGGTRVAGGTLVVGADANLGAGGGLTFDGGALRFAGGFTTGRDVSLATSATLDTNGNDVALSGTVSGAGGLTKTGAGTLTLSGTNTHTGGTVISGGTVVVASDANLGQTGSGATGRLTFDGGTLRILGTFTAVRDVTLNAAGGTVDTNGHELIFSQVVDGEGGLTKTGAGDLILSGTYTYRGGTRVQEGNVLFQGSDQLPTDTPVVVDSGVLDLNGNDQEVGSLSGSGGKIELTNATLTVNQSSDGTFAGTVAGAGGLVKNGTATLILTGQSSNSGPTDIQAGSLQAGADSVLSSASSYTVGAGADLGVGATRQEIGSLAGAGTVTLSTGTLTVGANDTSTEFAGSINGGGGLVKTGAGRLNLTGNNLFTGLATVQNGTMAVNGSLGGSVLVASGGALGGSGVVGGPVNVQSGGVLSPGNSPGTLSVTSSVTLNPGSLFDVEVDGPGTGTGAGNYDRLLVTGAGNGFTAGGTLAPRLRGITGAATNTFTPVLGQGFTIVEAEGGVSGSFAGLTQPAAGLPAGTRFDVVYGSRNVGLHVTPLAYADLAAAGEAETPIQIAVGSIVDRLRPAAGTLPGSNVKPLFDVLYVQDGDGIRSTLDQLAGRGHADGAMTALSNARMARQTLNDRITLAAEGGVAARAMAAPSVRLNYDGATQASAGIADGGNGDAAAAPGRVWGRVVSGRADVGDDGNPGRNVTTAGFLVGVDERLDGGPLVGAALGYVRGEAESSSPDTATVESYSLSAYGRHAIGPMFVDGTAGYSYNRYEVERPFLGTMGGGTTHGHGASASLTLGYQARLDSVSVIPTAGLGYDVAHRGNLRETGLLGLEIESDTVQSLSSSIGVRVRVDDLTLGDGVVFEPELRAAWEHEFADTNATSRAGLAGIGFSMENADVGRDAAVLGAGVAIEVSDSVRFYTDYQADLRKNLTGHTLSAGLRINW